ncbi:UBP1-associated protein 2C-like [Cornus florida]|uniref:UBP1-associated protein 2C-like n=1 Tax=Cornus florida TaxID=4283 RepID=UPI00289DC10F|nr:UBP1-associated protein 2C-like [Cornus florida]XP_059661448.1 UBP1-associated protein 2C-like [Cornus florida]
MLPPRVRVFSVQSLQSLLTPNLQSTMDPIKKRKMEENGVVLPGSDSGPINLTLEDAQKIIEPFTREQLLEIVKHASVRHHDVLDAVRSIANQDPAQRKLFIRGLGWDTTTEKLRALFGSYGDLEEAIVILDKATGKSKGYGFVTFRHVDGALLALKEPSKKIDGRMTVTQLAAAGITPTPNPQPVEDVLMRKIYVANVPQDMPGDRLLAHFLSYGEIEEGPLGFDKATGKSKGYALFVYKTVEAARASLVDPIKMIDGHNLTCKLADGKKGKPGVPGVLGAGGVHGSTAVPGEGHGDGVGLHVPSSIPGSIPSHYGGPGGPGLGGISSYSGYSGGLQGPPPQGHHHLNSSLGGAVGLSSVGGGPGLSTVGSQAPSSLAVSGGYGSGLGGSYGVSSYGGPGSTGYGGPGSTGYGGPGSTGYGGPGSTGYGGLGGAGGHVSSFYGLPASSVGMPTGGYPESAHYSLSSSGYQSHHHQPTGASPVPRVPHGGMLKGIPPYY